MRSCPPAQRKRRVTFTAPQFRPRATAQARKAAGHAGADARRGPRHASCAAAARIMMLCRRTPQTQPYQAQIRTYGTAHLDVCAVRTQPHQCNGICSMSCMCACARACVLMCACCTCVRPACASRRAAAGPPAQTPSPPAPAPTLTMRRPPVRVIRAA
jgi:hypothetical protein